MNVPVTTPVTQTRDVQVTEMVAQQQTRTVTVMECVPQQQTISVPVTTYQRVARQVTVCVPVVTSVPSAAATYAPGGVLDGGPGGAPGCAH